MSELDLMQKSVSVPDSHRLLDEKKAPCGGQFFRRLEGTAQQYYLGNGLIGKPHVSTTMPSDTDNQEQYNKALAGHMVCFSQTELDKPINFFEQHVCQVCHFVIHECEFVVVDVFQMS